MERLKAALADRHRIERELGAGLSSLSLVNSGVAILKIFVYDLSFLGTLYRFLSFGVLGVILLATSYLYTRYRSAIFGVSTTEQPPYEPPDHP